MLQLQKWSNKQLTEFGLIDRVNESNLRESFSSKTHECDLRIIGLHWSNLNDEKSLVITAVGEYDGEMQKFKMKIMNPSLPRIKSLEEIIDGKIFAMCHYAQFTALSNHRQLLTCYCKVEKTDGKKFNPSTSPISKDLGEMIESLPSKKFVRSSDYMKFSDLPIRDIREL